MFTMAWLGCIVLIVPFKFQHVMRYSDLEGAHREGKSMRKLQNTSKNAGMTDLGGASGERKERQNSMRN